LHAALASFEKLKMKAHSKSLAPHFLFLEYYALLETLSQANQAKLSHIYRAHLGRESVLRHELIGYFMASLPTATFNAVFGSEALAELNHLLLILPLEEVLQSNTFLAQEKIDLASIIQASRILKYELGVNHKRVANALALYLTVIYACCEPKIKKHTSLAPQVKILTLAAEVIHNIAMHVFATYNK
jgi:hypothetical protein